MNQTTPEHKRLELFAGKWNTEGQTVDGVKVQATDVYEWLPGGHFLLHQWHAVLGEDISRGIEILGYDTSSQAYHSRFYDDQGNTDAYDISVEGSIWKFSRSTERSTVMPSEDGKTLHVHWELNDNGKWKPWMDLVLSKVE